MSLTATIETAVDSAFSAAGDLVKLGVLKEKDISGFNFSTGQVTSKEVTYKVEIIESSSKLDEDQHVVKELLIRDKDLDGSRYSTIAYDGKTYRIQTIQEYPGIIQLTVRSE
jgi:uncharacterized membrane-anchored protein